MKTRHLSPPVLLSLFLISATCALYVRLLIPGEVLIQRDAFRLHYPIRHFFKQRVAAGEFPLWYPFDGLGRPFIDTAHGAVFHPFSLLYLFVPALTGYKLTVLLSCLAGALGSSWLARRLGATLSAAGLAGVCFAFSGYIASLSDNVLFLYSACLLPAFLAALDRALERRGSALIGPALLWASAVLMGDPQGALIFGLVGGGWALWRGAGARPTRVARFAVIAALAFLLSAAQLVPAFAAFRGSARAHADLFHAQAVKWSTAPQRLLQLFVAPVADETTATEIGRVFFAAGENGYWARSVYLGMPILLLATFVLARRRSLWPLGAFLVTFLVLALGSVGGLYDLFYRFVPLWSAFRYPEKLLGFFTCFAVVLAGLGLDELRERPPRAAWWLAVGTVLAAAGVVAGSSLLSEHPLGGAPPALWRSLLDACATGLFCAAGTVLALAALTLALHRQWLRPAFAGWVLIAVVALDLSRANGSAYRTGTSEIAEFMPALASAIEAEEGLANAPGLFRIVSFREPRFAVPRTLWESMGPDAEVVAVRNALDQEHNGILGLETTSAYLPGEPAALKPLLMDKAPPGVLAHFNVKYLIGAESRMRDRGAGRFLATLPGFDLVLALNPVPPRPRAYLAPKVEPLLPDDDWKARLQSEEFLTGAVDFVEASTLPQSPGAGSAEIVSYAPEVVRIQTMAERDAVLVLSDAWDSGWEATIDGHLRAEILRANKLVRAVVVPAGKHVVEFKYRPTRVAVGVGLSLLGLLTTAGWSVVEALRRRQTCGTAA